MSPTGTPPPLARSRVVLVADAAASVGRATAILLAERGHVVLACSSSIEALADLPRETQQCGVVEISDALPGARAARAVELFGRLDAIVATSGAPRFGRLASVPPSEALAPLYDALALIAEATPLLSGGRVVLASLVPALPFAVAAAAVRGAFQALADPLRLELRTHGIQLISVSTDLARPGPQDASPLEALQRALSEGPGAHTLARPLAATLRAMARQAPTPAAIAEVIVRALLAPRPKARYLLRNGGRIIGRPTRPLDKARGKL